MMYGNNKGGIVLKAGNMSAFLIDRSYLRPLNSPWEVE
jgi:hypothetical protein